MFKLGIKAFITKRGGLELSKCYCDEILSCFQFLVQKKMDMKVVKLWEEMEMNVVKL